MFTQCPSCQTTFQVTAEQLKAANGEILQWKSQLYPEWKTINNSVGASFVFDWREKDYRIKPKPLEFWVTVCSEEQSTSPDKNNTFNPRLGFGDAARVIKVREVTDE